MNVEVRGVRLAIDDVVIVHDATMVVAPGEVH